MATQFFTDSHGEFQKRTVFAAESMPGVATMIPSGESRSSDFLGFGVAITGSSCYLLDQMEASERTVLLKQLYSADGLNLSVGRLTIGSSDYSAELYSYDDTPFDLELSHFSVERDEAYVIPMVKEILKIRPDLYLFASPWSPPGWMKTGGLICGGYMRDEFVDVYADYIVKYIKAYRDHGINIKAITPQNEPETQEKGKMPACIWHPETEAKFICSLKKKLSENGLDIKIWMYDQNFDGADRVIWMLENCKGLRESCDAIAFHYYNGTIEYTDKVQKLYPELNLHLTEGGPRLYDHYDNDWCKWGIMTAKTFKHNYRSLTGWNLMLDETGNPNIGPFGCGGFVTRNSQTHELSFSGQYKAFRHIAPYLGVGDTVCTLSPDRHGQMMFGYPKIKPELVGFTIKKPDGSDSAVILINPNESEKAQVRFELNGKMMYAELSPASISTII